MTITGLAELAADARKVAEDFLARAGAVLPEATRQEILADLAGELCDRLDAGSSAADVRSAIVELGPVGPPAQARRGLAGTVWGVPYDFTPPTPAKIAERFWDPTDPRVWRPHVFGVGWSVNLGALAVRWGLIEPDAEDVPLESAPSSAFTVALAVPIAVCVATAATASMAGRRLPEEVPVRFTLGGEPTRRAPRARVLATDVAVSVVPTVVAALVTGRAAPGRVRAGAIVAATLVTGGALSSLANTVVGARRGRICPWATPAALALTGSAVFAILLGLSRAGRHAEQDRDLPSKDAS